MAHQRKMCNLLPPDVRKSLFSESCTIRSFSSCVDELVMNSIDAAATEVRVTVNFETSSVAVEDNGIGLTKEDMVTAGQRYCTSKVSAFNDLDKLETYGYRGSALAAIIDCSSEVWIISKVDGSPAYYKKLAGGKETSVKHCKDNHLPTAGTMIKVKGLFTKPPPHHRSIQKDVEIQGIKKIVERLFLLNFRVAITAKDERTGIEIARCHTAISLSDALQKLDNHRYGRLHHQNFVQETSWYDLILLEGVVCQDPHPDGGMQYVLLNKHYISRTNKKIYGMIQNRLAATLGFETRSSCSSNDKSEECKYNSPTKGRDAKKYSSFIVNISCPWSQYTRTQNVVQFMKPDSLDKAFESFSVKLMHTLKIAGRFERAHSSKATRIAALHGLDSGGHHSRKKNNDKLDNKNFKVSGPGILDLQRAIQSGPAVKNIKYLKAGQDGRLEKYCENSSRKRKMLDVLEAKKGMGVRMPVTAKKSKAKFSSENFSAIAQNHEISSSSSTISWSADLDEPNDKKHSDSESIVSQRMDALSLTPVDTPITSFGLGETEKYHQRDDTKPAVHPTVDAYKITDNEAKSAAVKIKIPNYKNKVHESLLSSPRDHHNLASGYIGQVDQRQWNKLSHTTFSDATAAFKPKDGNKWSFMDCSGGITNKRHAGLWNWTACRENNIPSAAAGFYAKTNEHVQWLAQGAAPSNDPATHTPRIHRWVEEQVNRHNTGDLQSPNETNTAFTKKNERHFIDSCSEDERQMQLNSFSQNYPQVDRSDMNREEEIDLLPLSASQLERRCESLFPDVELSPGSVNLGHILPESFPE